MSRFPDLICSKNKIPVSPHNCTVFAHITKYCLIFCKSKKTQDVTTVTPFFLYHTIKTDAESIERRYVMNRFQRACCTGAEDARSRSAMRERAAACSEGAACMHDLPIAMAYVPSQRFENLYGAADGWHHGTIFADLNKPYEGGCCR